jgi:hypothetical protein
VLRYICCGFTSQDTQDKINHKGNHSQGGRGVRYSTCTVFVACAYAAAACCCLLLQIFDFLDQDCLGSFNLVALLASTPEWLDDLDDEVRGRGFCCRAAQQLEWYRFSIWASAVTSMYLCILAINHSAAQQLESVPGLT